MPRFETATPAPDTAFLDWIDEVTSGTVSEPISIRMRGAGRLQAFPASQANGILNASAGAPNVTDFGGSQWWGGLTQALVGLRAGREGAQLTQVSWWPLGLAWGAFPASALALNLRYRFTSLVQRTVPVLGDGRVGAGIMYTVSGATGLLSEEVATAVGLEISSKPSVNGGAWTAYWRTVSGGALQSQVGAPAVVPDGTFQLVGWQYDTATGVVAFIVNGEPVVVLPAAANPDPTTVAGVPVQRLGVFQYSSGVINQQDRWGSSRFTVERI